MPSPQVTIGVAIPVCKDDLVYLKRCLDSIAQQKRLPDAVAISASGCAAEDIPALPSYKFPLSITSTLQPQNTSKNRNCAAELLDTKFISFFDSDDEMCAERLAFIERAITSVQADFVLHNFCFARSKPSRRFAQYKVQQDILQRKPPPRVVVHNGHVTVSKALWARVRYNETFTNAKGTHRGQDKEFNRRALAVCRHSAYLQTELCWYYHPSKADVNASNGRLHEKPEHLVSVAAKSDRRREGEGRNRRAASGRQRTKAILTWETLLRQPKIYLYAGRLPVGPRTDWRGIDRRKWVPFVGLNLSGPGPFQLQHDITQRMPLKNDTVAIYQSEDVMEHIEYERLVPTINEIYRVLEPGGLFRLSVPDYRCNVLVERSAKTATGEIYYDPGGGGRYDSKLKRVVDGGHLWFPVYETTKALLGRTNFNSENVYFRHYYDETGSPVLHDIDYSLGYIARTPDHDERVQKPRRPMSIVVDCYKDTNK